MINRLDRGANHNYGRTLILALMACVLGDLSVGQSPPSSQSSLDDSIDVQRLLRNAKRPSPRIAQLPIETRSTAQTTVPSEPIPILPTSPTPSNGLSPPEHGDSVTPLKDLPEATSITPTWSGLANPCESSAQTSSFSIHRPRFEGYPVGTSQQANQGREVCQLLDPHGAASFAGPSPSLESAATLPATGLWWESPATSRMAEVEGLRFGIQELVEGALIHSSRIRVLSLQPAIRRTELAEEVARFNWRSFLETKFDNQNDPIGNTLTTGNDSRRFTQETASFSGGVRRTNRRGGEVQLSQKLWYLENNSRFLDPNPQGNTRLELQYTQPLLNGAGRAVNESRIALADIAVGTADDQWVDDLQQHLEAVSQAYWELYYARCDALQRQRLLHRAEEIREILLSRQTFDGDRRQLLRAETAVASRQSEIVRAVNQIRNAEAQIRLLVNDATLARAAELTPREIPMMAGVPYSMGEALRIALLYRRDISRAIRDIQSSTVQVGVARNQILPKLDLMVSSYVAGLEGRGDAIRAFGNQFADGRPGYAFGLLFEAPFHNDAAQARAARSRLELQRAVSGFEWTVQQGLTQVELAVREVSTTDQEVAARYRAMLASRQETEFLLDRWRTIAGVDDSAANLLENLLDSQVRLAEEERSLVRAQVNYAIAVLRLKREMGTLIQIQGCN